MNCERERANESHIAPDFELMDDTLGVMMIADNPVGRYTLNHGIGFGGVEFSIAGTVKPVNPAIIGNGTPEVFGFALMAELTEPQFLKVFDLSSFPEEMRDSRNKGNLFDLSLYLVPRIAGRAGHEKEVISATVSPFMSSGQNAPMDMAAMIKPVKVAVVEISPSQESEARAMFSYVESRYLGSPISDFVRDCHVMWESMDYLSTRNMLSVIGVDVNDGINVGLISTAHSLVRGDIRAFAYAMRSIGFDSLAASRRMDKLVAENKDALMENLVGVAETILGEDEPFIGSLEDLLSDLADDE